MARIFLLSPFREPFDSLYRDVLKPGLQTRGHSVTRVDEVYSPGIIVQDIFNSILDADCIIAEITRANANVFYEIGIAHSYGKSVVLLTQSTEHIPFDIRHMRCLKYDTTEQAWEKTLVERVADAIDGALLSAKGTNSHLPESVFSGRVLDNFADVIQTAESMIARSSRYFFVTRTSPNESILPHESRYFEITDARIRGIDDKPPLPNYRRIVRVHSHESLELAIGMLRLYADAPNFQMAVSLNHNLPINFEVFVSDDRRALVVFGTEQGPSPLDSGILIENPFVAQRWKAFFLNLWDQPSTRVLKRPGALKPEDVEKRIAVLEDALAEG